MKSKVSPAAIGVFISGAVLILFASIVLFGSGRFFKHTKDYLLTFQEPVTGLQVGAPVKLAGVSVGDVQDISVSIDPSTGAYLVHVRIEVDRAGAKDVFQGDVLRLDDRALFENAVNKEGLRGKLDILSMLSGQLYIAMDKFPGQKGFRMNQESEHGLWEIPTLPSTKRQMMQSLVGSLHNLTQFDFEGISEDLKRLLADLRQNLEKMELGQVSKGLQGTLKDAQSFLAAPEMKSAITNLNQTLANLDGLTGTLDEKAGPLLDDLEADLKKLGATLDEASEALASVKAELEPGSTLNRELVNALGRAGQALDAVRELAQELQRNPNALITGKKTSNP